MRKSTVLALSLVVVFMTAGMGLPIVEGGKLAVSNLTPLVFIGAAALFYLSREKTVDRRLAWFFLLFNVSCVASFVIFLVKYEWTPNFPVLFYDDAEILFCVLLWWFGTESPDAFRSAVKLGLWGSIPVSILFGLHELHNGLLAFYDGMDDKSQGAVLLCSEAYVLIRFFGTKPGRLAGVCLYVSSFLTVSRLPVFFFPAIFLGLMRRSRLGAFVTLAAMFAAAYVMIASGNAVKESFAVYQRLSSIQEIEGSGSTQAHLELIKTALEIKFTEPLAFVFGTGPDNFSKALFTKPESVDKLEALDPVLVAAAVEGQAPVHSTTLEMLLDYNIGIFLIFAFLLARAFHFLIQRRNLTDFFFASGFLLASTFYSTEHKPYFFLYVATVAVLIATEEPAAVLHPEAGTGEPAEPAGSVA